MSKQLKKNPLIKKVPVKNSKLQVKKNYTKPKPAKSTVELNKSDDFNFSILAETSPSAIFIYSRDKVHYVNDAAVIMTGFSKDEMLKMHFRDLIYPEDREKVQDGSTTRISGKNAPILSEFRIVTKGKNVRWIDFAANLIDYKGKPAAVGIALDITEKKIAEHQLRENEEGYRTLFEGANDAIFIMQEGLFISCNEKTLQMFKCKAEEIIGKSPIDFSPPIQPDGRTSKESAEEKINLAYTGYPQFFEWKHLHYDRTPFDAEVGLNKIEVQGVSYLQAIVKDITGRKKAEEAIKQSEKQFRTIFENAPIGKCLTGIDGNFMTVNYSLCEILGYKKDELVNKPFSQYTHPDDVEKSKIWVQKMLKGENVSSHMEKRYLHKDGHTIWTYVSTSLFRDSSGSPKYFITQILDISQRKTTEENIKKFKFIVDNTGEEFYLVQPYGRLEYVNRAAALSLGYSVEELLQIDVPGFDLSYATSEEYHNHFLQLRERDIPAFETLHRTKDGRLLTKLVKAVYLLIGDKEYICGFANDISESKKASDKIKQSEEKFRLLFTSTSQAVTLNEIILDENNQPVDYRILDANPSFEVQTGIKCNDIIGKKVLDVLPDTETYWIREFGEVALTGKPKHIENISRTLNKYFDFYIYSPRKGQFVLISTDITKRKKEEEINRLNEARLEALIRLNNLSDKPLEELTDYALEEAVKLTGSKFGYLAFMNDDESIIQLHSWSSEVMNMCKVKDSYHQFIVKNTGLLGEPIRRRKPVITNDYAAENSLKHGFPEGHVPIGRHMSVPIFENDRIVILAGVANKETNYDDADINQLTLLMDGMWRLIQRRKADEALKESEERYRLITNNSNDIIVKFGTNGKISFVSPVCKTLLGYEISDMLKHSVFDFFHPDDIPYLRMHQEKLLQQKAPNLIKHRLRKKDGDYLWFETNNQIIQESDGGIKEVVAVIRDISELLHSEKLIKEKEAAELASKAKSEFLANMSHEIRNPLNSIIGLSNSLTRINLNEEQRNIVESLKISSNNLLNILNDILDFSKIEANKVEVVNNHFSIHEVINDIFSSNKTTADFKNLAYKYIIEENVPEYLFGDSIKFKQILINLTGNALKFTEKGSVIIYIKEIQRENDQTRLRIEVTDTGIGIKKEDLSKLFESFTQLDSSTTKSYSGTGLGLAIVKRYVELLNGRVGVDSQYKKGSTFFTEIPFKISEKNAAELHSKQFKMNEEIIKPAILLAEDDGINQLYLKGFLNKMGYEVDTAFNGVQAIEKFNSKKYDIILMDGQMPKMDGFEATRLIREKEKSNKKHTTIIAITGYAVSGDKEKFMNAGMDDYLSKPIDENRLVELLQKYSK
jgi:two-component system, sensor histidine kinase and response regulator